MSTEGAEVSPLCRSTHGSSLVTGPMNATVAEKQMRNQYFNQILCAAGLHGRDVPPSQINCDSRSGGPSSRPELFGNSRFSTVRRSVARDRSEGAPAEAWRRPVLPLGQGGFAATHPPLRRSRQP